MMDQMTKRLNLIELSIEFLTLVELMLTKQMKDIRSTQWKTNPFNVNIDGRRVWSRVDRFYSNAFKFSQT